MKNPKEFFVYPLAHGVRRSAPEVWRRRTAAKKEFALLMLFIDSYPLPPPTWEGGCASKL